MPGVSIRDLNGRIDIVSTSKLEKKLGQTIMSCYSQDIDDYFLNQLSSNGKIAIPTLQRFLELAQNYSSDLLEFYLESLGYEGVGGINTDTMIAQAALLDSLCFVYDSYKDEYTIATMNFELLYDFEVKYDMVKQVLTKNRQGIVKAYRVDIEYINSGKEFKFRVVNARDYDIDESKSDGDGSKRFYLIPYLIAVRLMWIIDKVLSNGNTLRITQDIESMGIEKTRLISKDYDTLSSMCDIPEAVKGLSPKFFPLKGFFYAPVVGASSTSSMLTKINIFDIDIVRIVTDKDYKKFNVYKRKNSLKELIEDSLIVNKLICIKNADLLDFTYLIDKLPRRNELISQDVGNLSESGISKYLHSLSEEELQEVCSIVEVSDEVPERMELFSNGRLLNIEDVSNIEELLKKGIVKLVLQKKDCKLSSVICTNNRGILSDIYGSDYVKKYEGFSVKFYSIWSWLKYKFNSGSSFNDTELKRELNKVGFPSDEEVLQEIKGIVGEDNSSKVLLDRCETDLMYYFAEKMGINPKMSNHGEGYSKVLLARTLTAYIDNDDNPVDYYRYIDKSKIIGGMIFSK